MKASQFPVPISPTEKGFGRTIQQWGGLAFAVGNVLFLVNKLDEMSRLFLSRPMPDVISGQNVGRILVGQVALLIGYVCYYQFYAPRTDTLGRYILRLFSGGGMLVAICHVTFMSGLEQYFHISPASYDMYLWTLLVIGLLFMLIGLISFGIFALRQRVMTRWRWLPLATGLMGFIPFFLLSLVGGEDMSSIFLVFRTFLPLA